MNTDDLKDYIDTRFADLQRENDIRYVQIQKLSDLSHTELQSEMDRRMQAIQSAVLKAEIATRDQSLGTRDYMDTRFTSILLAIDKSEKDVDRRLINMNAFREQLKDQTAQFPTRSEIAANREQIAQQLSDLRDLLSTMVPRPEFNTAKEQAAQTIKANHDRAETMVTRQEFSTIQRLVYIGLGGVLALEIILQFAPRPW